MYGSAPASRWGRVGSKTGESSALEGGETEEEVEVDDADGSTGDAADRAQAETESCRRLMGEEAAAAFPQVQQRDAGDATEESDLAAHAARVAERRVDAISVVSLVRCRWQN